MYFGLLKDDYHMLCAFFMFTVHYSVWMKKTVRTYLAMYILEFKLLRQVYIYIYIKDLAIPYLVHVPQLPQHDYHVLSYTPLYHVLCPFFMFTMHSSNRVKITSFGLGPIWPCFLNRLLMKFRLLYEGDVQDATFEAANI